MWHDMGQLIWLVAKILMIMLPLLLVVAYVTFAERKVIGFMQCRISPNRVGFCGLLQPIADVIKMLCKEVVIPSASNRMLFIIAPALSLVPALLVWSVIPFAKGWVLANINAGILFVFAMSSLGVYGVLVAGWASNSKYAFFSAVRATAQTISYEIAMGFCFVGILLATGTMNLSKIILQQAGGMVHWYIWPLFPLFVVYWIVGVAETNRAPFDVVEGESEIVAGFHVEYSGVGFAAFFLAEYMNMLLISAIAVIAFLGGYLSPFQGVPVLGAALAWVPGIAWFALKIAFFMFLYFWMRATFPRYRYDQIMALGWKVLIPLTLAWILVESIWIEGHLGAWFS